LSLPLFGGRPEETITGMVLLKEFVAASAKKR
jgi:hypothetical protein